MSVPTPRMIGGNHRVIGQRYGGRHGRTVKRWIARGEFPRPDLVINNRPYWHESTLNEFDRQRVAASLSQPRQARQPTTRQPLKRTTSPDSQRGQCTEPPEKRNTGAGT